MAVRVLILVFFILIFIIKLFEGNAVYGDVYVVSENNGICFPQQARPP
jgi:hypothetical protein